MTNYITPQTLKGFRDFLPEEAIKRQYVIEKIKDTFERFGFDPLETPALEYADTLLGKYGEESDKLLYLFEDQGKRQVGLRYDQTVPLARVAAQYPEIPKPFKRYQIQPVWRAENTQKGRYREFLQCDADIIGDKYTPTADAEILTLFWTIYNILGFKSFKIIVNSREILKYTIKKAFGVNPPDIHDFIFYSIVRAIDKFPKIGREGVEKEIHKIGFPSLNVDVLINTKVNSYKELEKIDSSLYYSLQMTIENFGVPEDAIKIDFTLARGLDYYTGLIFEGVDENYQSSIGGGGRYDKLIGKFTGNDISAVGFAIGFDRTVELANSLNLLPKKSTNTKIMVAVFEDWENSFPYALNLVTQIRNSKINCELYLNPREKLDKQLKYADKKGIPFVAIIGPNEARSGTVTIKNMNTKEQKTVKQEEVIQILRS